MKKEISIKQWVVNFFKGDYSAHDRKTQIDAGWFDWFCGDASLATKTAKMGKIITKIADGGKVNRDEQFIFFKNNCPMMGALYDQFSICDLKTGDVVYCIQNRNRKWQVYDVKNCKHDDSPHFEGTATALVEYLNEGK